MKEAKVNYRGIIGWLSLIVAATILVAVPAPLGGRDLLVPTFTAIAAWLLSRATYRAGGETE